MLKEGFSLRFFLIMLCAVFALGTFGFMMLEPVSLLDALYFNVATIATVGYGDIHPVTPAGKLLAMVVIITGVGVFLAVIATVTENMLKKHEKQQRMERLNVAIGLFFSELGTGLLALFARHDVQLDRIEQNLIIGNSWTAADFSAVQLRLQDYDYMVDINSLELEELKHYFDAKHTLLLRLMENPNLSEHESFTDMLMAVFHLRQELHARATLTGLPASDVEHLAYDIKRAYGMLVKQWLYYMWHLKESYPFLFSLAVRTNPFDRNASAIVS
ncbi:MAG: potassium channel family protein [Proteobacteria bacterium]|nr:potassium channel family protein [Pseudomonadota bacterium]